MELAEREAYLEAGAGLGGVRLVRPQGATTSRYLNGLAVDEVFARTTGATTSTYLVDGLGSTVGLAGSTGTVGTTYAYGPFGNTQVSGTADANPFQYAGRENDGATGLYFNRARYYSPEHGRFISEDPIGHASGDTNLYSYAANSPTNFTDPNGLCAGGMNGLSLATDMLTIAWDLHTRVNQLAAASMAQGWDPYAFADEVIAAGNAAQVDAAISAAAHCVPFAMAAIPGGASGAAGGVRSSKVTLLGASDDLTDFAGQGYRVMELGLRGPGRWNWTRNKRFIDAALESGDEIRLITNPNVPRYSGGNVYRRELNYIRRRGYNWEQRGDHWVVVPR